MEFPVIVDLELTNRCNADCYFCPRDATPHQGIMTTEVFEQSLARAVELHESVTARKAGFVRVNLCGLGEPLINKHTASFVQQVRAAGLECGLSSNAALLDETRGRALLDAGLQRAFLNVGEREEAYEEIYKLPWERTRDNVIRFVEMAGDDCEVYLVLVDHRRDKAHVEDMRQYWRGLGITRFMDFDIMNRGGALFVDHMQYADFPELGRAKQMLAEHGGDPICTVPFIGSLFIGYDGNFYLCCSDWKKEAPLGSVFDASFSSVTAKKLEFVISREPVCKTCNLDPVNRLTEELRAATEGQADAADPTAMAAAMMESSQMLTTAIDQLEPGIVEAATQAARAKRKLIPITAV